MLDRPHGGERAVLVNVALAPPAPACDTEEFAELAASALTTLATDDVANQRAIATELVATLNDSPSVAAQDSGTVRSDSNHRDQCVRLRVQRSFPLWMGHVVME